MARDTLVEPKTSTASTSAPRRSLASMLVAVIEVLPALIAIPPGTSLVQDHLGLPLGGPSGMIPILNRNLPFIHDLVPVGISLIVVYGALPIVAAVGVWRLKRWAWYSSSTPLGAAAVTWIAVELVMFRSLGFTWFYPLIGGIGLAILAPPLLSTVRHSLLLRGV